MSGTDTGHLLIAWILDALERPRAWSAEQISFLDSVLAREEGTRVLSSLVVTALRLRQSTLKPEEKGPLCAILPSIEAFWNDPSQRTFQELRIARW